jgi:hypothetical protein
MAREPDSSLAARVLPAALRRALVHVFEQEISGCMLVGGTALAGYYAGHRRSDDLDLFTRDAAAHRATVLAVQSLTSIGARVAPLQNSAQFFAASCSLEGHHFSAQVVLDANLFAVGSALPTGDGVVVADLDTLLKMKAATIVSRCGEKDLFDLLWLFDHHPELDLATLVELGAQIDGGMTAEAALLSLVGARLTESACHFSTTQSAADVFADISVLRERLEIGLERVARNQPVPPIAELIRALKP